MLILKNFIGWALEGMSFNDWSDVVAPKVQKHLAFAQRTAFVGTGLFFPILFHQWHFWTS